MFAKTVACVSGAVAALITSSEPFGTPFCNSFRTGRRAYYFEAQFANAAKMGACFVNEEPIAVVTSYLPDRTLDEIDYFHCREL